MELIEKLKERKTTLIFAVGIVGLLLLMISAIFPDEKPENTAKTEDITDSVAAETYRTETEERLKSFLEKIEGAGEVEVYLTVGTGERYVYISEGGKYTYGAKEPLLETILVPEITGAVIVCAGGSSPTVEERIYKAVSSALGISSGKIYVTKMK